MAQAVCSRVRDRHSGMICRTAVPCMLGCIESSSGRAHNSVQCVVYIWLFSAHPERLRQRQAVLRLRTLSLPGGRGCSRAQTRWSDWSMALRSPGASDLRSQLPRSTGKSALQDSAETCSICRGRRSSRRYHPLNNACTRAMASAAVFAGLMELD